MGKCQLTYEDRAKGGRAKKRMKLRERGRAAARKRWGDRPAPTADEQQQQKQPKGPKQPTKAELTAQIAQLNDTLAELKTQNNALRLRLLSAKSRPRMIPKTPIYRLIAPTIPSHRLVAPTTPTYRLNSNSKPTTPTIRQRGSKNKNPTTQEFVAALKQQEEERKEVALLNNNMATISSNPPTNVDASTSSSSGIYANKQNAKTKQNQLLTNRRMGYMLFSSELGRQLMKENPSAGFAEVSKRVAIEWERLSDEQKRQYERAEGQVQVQAVQQRDEQHLVHDHHPPSASSAGSSSSSTAAAEGIKEEATDQCCCF